MIKETEETLYFNEITTFTTDDIKDDLENNGYNIGFRRRAGSLEEAIEKAKNGILVEGKSGKIYSIPNKIVVIKQKVIVQSEDILNVHGGLLMAICKGTNHNETKEPYDWKDHWC